MSGEYKCLLAHHAVKHFPFWLQHNSTVFGPMSKSAQRGWLDGLMPASGTVLQLFLCLLAERSTCLLLIKHLFRLHFLFANLHFGDYRYTLFVI
jgi:hypothetical protein